MLGQKREAKDSVYLVIGISLVENGKRFINMKFKLPASLLLTGLLSGLLVGCTSTSQSAAETNDASTDYDARTHYDQSANTAAAKMETYWVAPERVACQGVAPMQCLVVNKMVDGKTSEWQFFYNDIAGFEYVPGSFYKLSVETSAVKSPAADASSLSYKLVDEIDKTPRYYLDNTMLIESRKWNLKQLAGLKGINPPELPQPANITIAGGRFSGFAGCNNMFGQIQHLFEATDLNNSLLKLGPIGSTLMACADPKANAVEQKLHQALGMVNALQVEWPFLNMYQNDELLIQFVAEDWD